MSVIKERAEEWRAQAERWNAKAATETNALFLSQDYSDRDTCLVKMSAAITLATEITARKGEGEA